jgi:chromosome segregation ATPase
MSVLKNIGFDEVLNRLGLTEAQVKVIYSGEIEKLEKQERVLLESIDRMAKKTEEQYLERQKLSQVMDSERLEIENGKKAILALKNDVSEAKAALERDKRDVTALHVKLDEAKGVFRQERAVYEERLANLEAGEKSLHKNLSDLGEKEKILENLKDELYLKKRDLDIALKEAGELKAKLDSEKNDLLSLKLAIDDERKRNHDQKDSLDKRETAIETLVKEAQEELTRSKESFYLEKRNSEESLRKREVAVAKKERFIEETEASIRKKHEDAIIEEGRKKR